MIYYIGYYTIACYASHAAVKCWRCVTTLKTLSCVRRITAAW